MVLQKVRDNASGLVVKVILWGLVVAFIGTIFLVWGVGDDAGQAPIATVYGEPISYSKYLKKYDEATKKFGKTNPEFVKQSGFGESVLNNLIMDKLQLISAKSAGLVVTTQELKSEIARNKTFQSGGVFNKNLYNSVLQQSRLTAEEFESKMKDEMIAGKLLQLVSYNAQVTDGEIKAEYDRVNESIKIKYALLSPAKFEKEIKLTDKDVENYYQKNRFRYQEPETREVDFIYANPIEVAKTMDVPAEKIKAFYDLHLSDYTIEEKASARHILLTVPKGATKEVLIEKRKKAEKYLKLLKEGADFAEMAKKYSEGPSAPNGGELGEFSRGMMVPEFEKAVFSMKAGEISDIVRTDFGFHIIKVESIKKGGVLSLEKVSASIKQKIAEQDAIREAKKEVHLAVKSGEEKDSSWKEIASLNGLEYGQISIQKGKPAGKIPNSEKISKRAFQLEEGKHSSPMRLDNGYYAIRLKKILPARRVKLHEVENEIKALLLIEKSQDLLKTRIVEIVKQLNDGAETLTSIADKYQIKVSASDYFKRGKAGAGILSQPAIQSGAFATPSGKFQYVSYGNNYYLLQVVERKSAGMDGYKEQRKDIKKKLLQRKRFYMLADWRRSLKELAERENSIEIKKELL